MRIWDRYGLPGLAMAGPLITGIHLATVIALLFKPERSRLIFWMTSSLLVWTAGLVFMCYAGLDAVRRLIGQ